MAYRIFDKSIIHRPIIHLLREFLVACNRHSTILDRAEAALPMIANELDISSISLFKLNSKNDKTRLVYSWHLEHILPAQKRQNLLQNHPIESIFNQDITAITKHQDYFYSSAQNSLGFLESANTKIKDFFIAKVKSGNSAYGYLIFTFDVPIQFDKEILDTFSSFTEILSVQTVTEQFSKPNIQPSTLLDKAQDIMMVINQQGRILEVNDAYHHILGHDEKVFIGKDFREAFDFVNDRGHAALRNALSGEPLKNIALEVYSANNEIHWLSFTFCPYKHAISKEKLFLITTCDISYLKEIEINLRKSDVRSYLTSKATRDVFYEWNFEKDTIWWNNNLHDHFGYITSPEIFTRNWWLKQINPKDIRGIQDAIEKAIKNKQNTYSLDYRLKNASGEYIYVNDTAYISYDKNNIATQINGSIKDIHQQQLTENALRISRDSLSNLAHRLQDVREDERKSLSRELHDEFAQLLTAMKLDISYIEKKYDMGADHMQTMRSIVDQMMDRVQTISRELRPTILDDLGLIHAINWQLNNFYELTGCDVIFVNYFDEVDFKQKAITGIFRIFQEALSNIARHSNATEIYVSVKNRYSRFTLTIKDNGQGIDKAFINNPNAIGLLGMKERAYALHGDVLIQHNKPRGVIVTLVIPTIECIESYKNKNWQTESIETNINEVDLIRSSESTN